MSAMDGNEDRRNILLVISIEEERHTDDVVAPDGYTVKKLEKDIVQGRTYLTKTDKWQLINAFLNEDLDLVGKLLSLAEGENDGIGNDDADEDFESLGRVSYQLEAKDSASFEWNLDKIQYPVDHGQRAYPNNGYYPNLFELFRDRFEVRIAVDDRVDPECNLRRLLWRLAVSDIQLSQNDTEYALNVETQQVIRLDTPEAEKPCYYPSQENAASKIIKRIRFIFKHYHSGRNLEDFKDFDFRIYTARSNMLEEQTLNRLCDKRAKCFSSGIYDDKVKLRETAEKHVRKYVITKDTDEERAKLKKNVSSNPDKLFLIVADEAHWGISKKTLHKDGANHSLINTWNHVEHPNVIIMLVTATPWNLLTENSRLPEVTVAEEQTGDEFVIVNVQDQLRRKTIRDDSRRDITDRVGVPMELHVFKWTEIYDDYFQQGLVVKLRVPQRFSAKSREESIWLDIGDTSLNGFHSIVGTNRIERATPFLLKRQNGVVRITTEDERMTLAVSPDGSGVGFYDTRKLPNNSESSRTVCFRIHMEFGEDVIQIQSLAHDLNHLFFSYSKNEAQLGLSPAKLYEIDASRSYLLLIDHEKFQKNSDQTGSGLQYLSLNFYYNTIRNTNRKDQLIRSDPDFDNMAKDFRRSKTDSADDCLAAEYAYYIVLMKLIRSAASQIDKSSIRSFMETGWTVYDKDRQKQIQRMSSELGTVDRTVPPISRADFERVVHHIETTASTHLDKFFKDNRTIWLQTHYDEFLSRFIPYLMHSKSNTYFNRCTRILLQMEQATTESVRISSSFEEVIEELSRNETFRIINDLIQNSDLGQGKLNGHLKVVRTTDVACGNKFYATLTLARKVANYLGTCFFEVVRYFEKFKLSNHEFNSSVRRIWLMLQRNECSTKRCQCKMYEPDTETVSCKRCYHKHTPLSHFQDLDHLPCILVLVENGRMGDTFPTSFNVMDLRARQTSQPKLSSLKQEIGRMCRYQQKTDYSQLPYALVDVKLMKKFEETLQKNAAFQNFATDGSIDSYTRRGGTSSTGRRLRPNERNYDYENMDRHNNRILLQAEPQIGKTGVFLKTISLLKKMILGNDLEKYLPQTLVEEQQTTVLCEYDDSEDDEEDGDEVRISEQGLARDWKYPYWEVLDKDAPLKTETVGSKYDRIYGPYVYRNPPQYSLISSHQRKAQWRKTVIPLTTNNRFRMYSHIEHHDCDTCLQKATHVVKELEVNIGSERVIFKISIPNMEKFLPVLIKTGVPLETIYTRIPESEVLNTWIFNPTYSRSEVATINYHHAMVTMTNTLCTNYVQILVVRPEDFTAYQELWQETHAILELPSTLPGCPIDVNTGGIGYARRSVQLLAEALQLDYVFLIDDNIFQIFSVETETSPREEFSLFDVLKHLESMFTCQQPPTTKFASCCKSLSCSCWDDDRGSSFGLHRYTGPRNSYGVLGMRKFRPVPRNFIRSFRRAHVFSLVLLNIVALKEQKVLYEPWPVREDCNLNNDCDVNGLYVCKFNRFVFCKKSLSSLCIPKMYEWPKKVELKNDPLRSATSVTAHTLHWIRLAAPPKHLEIVNLMSNGSPRSLDIHSWPFAEDPGKKQCYGDIRNILKGLISTTGGKSHMVTFTTKNKNKYALIRGIKRYFEETNGIGGFDIHVIVLPVSICHIISTTDLNSFKNKVINQIFQEESDFSVLTTHNITKFRVPFVILFVKGKIKSPLDFNMTATLGVNANISSQEGNPSNMTNGEISPNSPESVMDWTSGGNEHDNRSTSPPPPKKSRIDHENSPQNCTETLGDDDVMVISDDESEIVQGLNFVYWVSFQHLFHAFICTLIFQYLCLVIYIYRL